MLKQAFHYESKHNEKNRTNVAVLKEHCFEKDLLQACFSTVIEPQVPRDFMIVTEGDGFAYICLILEVLKFSAGSETESLMLIMEEVAGE